MEEIRILRNNFAHGDWENVQKNLSSIEINDAFLIRGFEFKFAIKL